MPYHRVIGEFFSKKLGNFIDPEHTCACNLCSVDVEAAKQTAVESALAKEQLARASNAEAHQSQPDALPAAGTSADQPTAGGGAVGAADPSSMTQDRKGRTSSSAAALNP